MKHLSEHLGAAAVVDPPQAVRSWRFIKAEAALTGLSRSAIYWRVKTGFYPEIKLLNAGQYKSQVAGRFSAVQWAAMEQLRVVKEVKKAKAMTCACGKAAQRKGPGNDPVCEVCLRLDAALAAHQKRSGVATASDARASFWYAERQARKAVGFNFEVRLPERFRQLWRELHPLRESLTESLSDINGEAMA